MIKNCLSKIGCLTVLLLLAGAGWYYREDVTGWWNRLEITAPTEPSQAAADRAEKKLLRIDEGVSEVRLTEVELQSLLTYRLAPLMPVGVEDSKVQIQDSTMLLSAMLRPQQLTGMADEEILSRFLGDSTRVTAELTPSVFTRGVARLEVEALQAGSFVIPSPMIGFILGSLRIPGTEVSGRAILVPAPHRLSRLAVDEGALEFGSEPDPGN